MIECPRCGFVQPKDQYCANCGLDIENYKPKQDPFFKKLIKSPVFHLIFGTVVILTLVFGIYFQQKQQMTLPIEDSSPPARIIEKIKRPSLAQKTQPQPLAETQKLNILKKKPTTSTPSTVAPEEGLVQLHSIQVQFAEMTSGLLNQLLGETQALGDSVALYTKDLTRLTSDPRLELLPGTRTLSIGGDPQVLSFALSSSSSEDEQGLFIQIHPQNINQNKLDLDVEGFIHLKEEITSPLVQTNFSGLYSLKAPSTLLLIGVLPHQKTNESAVEQLTNSPLSIMNSDEFTNLSTEFVILIHVK